MKKCSILVVMAIMLFMSVCQVESEGIDMARIKTDFYCELTSPVKVQYLNGNVFSMDNNANTLNVFVTEDGQPVTLTGSISADVVRADGGTVTVTGSSSGNQATVVLPQACYAVPGVISITIKNTVDSDVTTLCAVVANVYQSSTDAVVDPGTIIPSVQALITEIETAVSSIPADYSALWTSLAPAFDSTKSYTAGQYVTYNGGVYRFTTSHSGSWAAGDVTAVNIGGELSDVKSAFNLVADGDHTYSFVQGARSQSTPTVVNGNSARVTTDEAIFLRKGDLLSVTGTYTGIKYTIIGKGTTTYQKAFGTGDYMLIAPFDGTYFVNVAKTDGTTAIIPSEATITVKATNKNHKILTLHDSIINDNLMGIDPPKNLYEGADTWSGTWNATAIANVSTADEYLNGYPVLYLSGTWQRYFKNIPVVSGKTYTFSVWVKAPTTTSIIVYITHSGTAATVATVSPTNKSYNNVVSANTWTKLSVTFTCSASGNVSPHVITGYGAGLYIAKYMLCEGESAFSLTDELNNRATLSDVSGIGDYRKYNFYRPTSESSTYWNPEITKDIPQGTKVKIIFDSYSGQYLTRMRIDGKKANNTYDEGIGSLYNPIHGGEVEFTTTAAYTALRVQFTQSTAETDITASVYVVTTDELGIANELLTMNASRVITVKKDGSGDFTKLVDAVQFACQFMDSVVYIGDGEYDIISEFGSTYMAAVDSSHNWGMELKNRVHLIGASRTVIKAINTSGSTNFDNIKQYFSVFNAGQYGFTIENLTIVDDSIRYSVHDDLGNAGSTPYHNRYLNCSMTHTNGMYPDCIGAGIGEDGYIEIIGCYFDGDTTRNGNPVTRYVYWHGNNNSQITTAKGRIFVRDCYFCKSGTFKLMNYGNSTTKTIAYISGNSFGSEPEIIDGSSPTPIIVNMEMVEWNNVVRP